jgi:hypothetical protein
MRLANMRITAYFITLSIAVLSSASASVLGPRALVPTDPILIDCPDTTGYSYPPSGSVYGPSGTPSNDQTVAKATALANLKAHLRTLVDCEPCATNPEGVCRESMLMDDDEVLYAPITGSGFPYHYSAYLPSGVQVIFKCNPTPTCPG